VVYNSDRTGIPQVYLVKVPERLFAELDVPASGSLEAVS
jgi:hypothetical protein